MLPWFFAGTATDPEIGVLQSIEITNRAADFVYIIESKSRYNKLSYATDT